MSYNLYKSYSPTATLEGLEVKPTSVKKKTVSFDPQVFKAVCNYQAGLIKTHGRPVSFSEALNALLKAALEDVSGLSSLEEVEAC